LVGVLTRPLWYDEAFAVLFAQKGVAAMVEGTISPAAENIAGAAADVHPLLYYSLLNLWMQVFGSSPAAVRTLSILFGTATVALLYVLSRALFDRRTGLLAALFAAISPFQVHYAQEVRMYALMGLLVIAAALALWQAVRTSRLRWWLLFALLAALAQYSHNLAGVHLAMLASTVLFTRQKKPILGVIFAGLGALLLYLPWLLLLPSQIARVRTGYWTEKPGVDRLITGLLSYITNLPLTGVWLPAGLFIALFVFSLAVWQSVRALSSSRWSADTWRGLWMAWLACTPLLALFGLSQWQPVFIERALLPSGAFFLIWVAWGFGYAKMPIPVRWFSIAALLFGMVIGLLNHWQYQGFPYASFPQLGQSLQERYLDGDLILHSNKLTALPLIYYAPELPQSYLPDPPESGSDTLAPATQHVLGLPAETDIESAAEGRNRVWLIIFDQAIEEYRLAGYETHPHLEWLSEHFSLAQTETYSDLHVYLYER
jgi:mannosyltransferase